jgi:hypothetical protein
MNGQLPGGNAEDGTGNPGILPGSRLAIRAEQALLGAVMSDPLRRAAVLDVVRPDDMYRPYHGQVLAAMQRLRARGVAPAPAPVRAELAHDPDLPRLVALDGARLADLLEAAPRPSHAPAYAAMVIDHSLRQQVMVAGSRMAQAAHTGDLDAALEMTAQARRDVQDCQARCEALPAYMRRELPRAIGGQANTAEEAAWQLWVAGAEIARARHQAQAGVTGDLVERLESIARHVAQAASAGKPADRGSMHAMGEPHPAAQAAEAAGGLLLRDLAAGPAQIPAVRGWLSPGHFARPAHGHLYALICDMHAVGQPVDPVTVTWEAAHHGIAIDTADLESGTAPFAVARAREVHRYGLLARISRVGWSIRAAAADPQVQPSVLLRDSGQWIRNLEHQPAPSSQQQPSDRRPRPAAQTVTMPAPDPSQDLRRPRDSPLAQASSLDAERA